MVVYFRICLAPETEALFSKLSERLQHAILTNQGVTLPDYLSLGRYISIPCLLRSYYLPITCLLQKSTFPCSIKYDVIVAYSLPFVITFATVFMPLRGGGFYLLIINSYQ
ncbi:hypothetical protein Barb7_02107 [Bacteroidales bacterium Barb7]|nr:hypothetical protein Barb7_02107 [Bacteroidales bacterium Barb7]